MSDEKVKLEAVKEKEEIKMETPEVPIAPTQPPMVQPTVTITINEQGQYNIQANVPSYMWKGILLEVAQNLLKQ